MKSSDFYSFYSIVFVVLQQSTFRRYAASVVTIFIARCYAERGIATASRMSVSP